MNAAAELRWFGCRHCGRHVRAGMRPHACFGCGAVNAHESTEGPSLARARERVSAASALPWAPLAVDGAADIVSGPPLGMTWASEAKPDPVERARTGWAPWAAVTSELPRRRVALVTGPRGAGKTRLCVQVAAGVAALERRSVVLATGEQSASEVSALVHGVSGPEAASRIAVLPTRRLEEAFVAARHTQALVVVLDGLQTFTFHGEPCRGGSRALSSAMDAIVSFAAAADLAAVVIPHMQSNGEQLGGGAVVQQLCHLIVRLWPVPVPDDAPDSAAQLVRLGIDGKNRHGPASVRRTLRWSPAGSLVEVGAPPHED